MGLQNPNNDFPLDMEWDINQIDFVNATSNDVTIDVFNSITLTNFQTTPLPNTFYIRSTFSFSYNAILQDIRKNPVMVRRIELITANQSQFNQPFNILKRDANGHQLNIPRLPNVDLCVNQIQSNIVSIDFNDRELILDDNTMFSQYTFSANTTTRMVIFYKQVNRIDLMTKGLSSSRILESNMNLSSPSFTESDLRRMSNEPFILNR